MPEAVISEAVSHQISEKAKAQVAAMSREEMVELLFKTKKGQFKAAEKQKLKLQEQRALDAEKYAIVQETLKQLGLYDEVMEHAKKAAKVELATATS